MVEKDGTVREARARVLSVEGHRSPGDGFAIEDMEIIEERLRGKAGEGCEGGRIRLGGFSGGREKRVPGARCTVNEE